MEVIRSVAAMTAWSSQMRQNGSSIGFVPTMGYLHVGHLQLMRRCRQMADKLVVSLFVNPIQFGPHEDLSRYPRDFKRDSDLVSKENTDILFVPENAEMYPEGYATHVDVKNITTGLCGKQRPGHFTGVATVVTKLFNIVQPTCAVFGEKDYQQLIVIKQLVTDLNMNIDIIGHDIVREPDGLAMSSRNTFLDEKERKSALGLYKSLQMARQYVAIGNTNADALIEDIRTFLLSHQDVEIEYIAIVNDKNLTEMEYIDTRSRLAMAVKVGKTRLIDNGKLIEYASSDT